MAPTSQIDNLEKGRRGAWLVNYFPNPRRRVYTLNSCCLLRIISRRRGRQSKSGRFAPDDRSEGSRRILWRESCT